MEGDDGEDEEEDDDCDGEEEGVVLTVVDDGELDFREGETEVVMRRRTLSSSLSS